VVVLAAQHLLQELALVVLVVVEILFLTAQPITALQVQVVVEVVVAQIQEQLMLLVQVALAS
jgi:hypothetical protein